LTFGVLTGAMVPNASAQEAEASADVAAARELGVEGVKLADAGDCAAAIDRLTRAERMHHAPSTLERLGECQIKVGKLVDGTEALRRVVREVLPATAPPAFLAAQVRAGQLLAEARPRIASLKIAVAAPPNAEFTVKIDGETVPHANLNANRPMDPGAHVIEASGPLVLSTKASVTLAEGGTDSVALTLQLNPSAPPPFLLPDGPVSPPGAEHALASSRSHTVSYVAFGVGGAGLVVGTALGIAALSAKSSIQQACPGKVCPPTEQSELSSAETKGTISTLGFIVGGVGVALGVTFYFAHPFSSGGSTTTGGYVQPYLSGSGGGFRGEF